MKVRAVLTLVAVAFSCYLAARGAFPAEPVERPLVLALGVALSLAATALVLAVPPPAADGRRGAPLPAWAAIVAVAVSAALPWIVSASTSPAEDGAPHVTWYIGAVGSLMTIVAVRRRAAWAWTGIVVLAVCSSVLLGVPGALALGLVGSTVWVGVGQLMQLFTDRAYDDTVKLASLQQASAAWQSTQTVRRRERRERVQYALQVAAPVLTQVIASHGALTEADRARARRAEGTLRDELRGARLLDDDVRRAIAALREGGASVTVLDEGGVDDLDEDALAIVRAELATTLRSTAAPRLIVRTAAQPGVAVTVVGRSAAGTGLPDEDAVALWHEIPRPTA
ncbi:hypothetical protein N8K70_05635 [Microbacterium betulae]|uniref:Uncharacterized protein n=1 Tax=Microbacterium betulae TaxID=2981139 RepID=A0AA97FJX4_9MICO|nr:hypothetical protein [Microbacterium sp. AB]WOF24154.1 hypothetical protein N8K70_05635 [Microbacterium sp. AB]